MTLLFEPSAELPLVRFGITFTAGRAHEPAGKDGLARVCARMLRRGSRKHSSTEIEQQLDRLGAQLHARVGFGITTVRCETLSRSLDQAIALVSELIAEPAFDEAELSRLKRQIDAELVNARDDDGALCARALRRQVFADHPHGLRVAGSRAGVAAITQADVTAFHREGYVRDHAIVSVTGDIDEAGAIAIAERLRARLPEGSERRYDFPDPAPLEGRRLVIVDKPERMQTQLGLGMLGTHPHDPDHVALNVANLAFGGTFTSTLMQEVRVKRGWAYGASSSLTVGRIREMFGIWTAPGRDDAPACLTLLLELLGRLREEGIDDEALDFCKKHAAASWPFEIDTADKRLAQKLDRMLLGLPDDYHQRWVERVQATTAEQIREAVARRLDPSRLWVSAVATESELREALAAAIPSLADTVVEPYDRD